MSGYSPAALVRPFAHRLLAVDLPGLSPARRTEVGEFAVTRVESLPSALRLGVTILAGPMRLLVAVPGSDRTLVWLINHPLPLVGEYVRMIRSLAYTYVWEHWPDAAPDGSTP